MFPEIEEESARKVKKQGTFMIIVGWALAIGVLTLGFSRVLERERNPNTLRALSGQQGEAVLQANRNGMYHAAGSLNGYPVEYLVDTGATYVAVPLEVAYEAGMELGPQSSFATANGTARGWLSSIDSIELGGIVLHDVDAVVMDNLGVGVLLGMSALSGLQITVGDDSMVLRPDY